MPSLHTRYFGPLQYDADAEFEFATGIPGFEQHTRFIFVQQPHADPLVFMQSFHDAGLCFITVPVFVVDANYRFELAPDDRAALDLPPGGPLEIGRDLVCLALVTVAEGCDPVANLKSPIVLNLRDRKGMQVVQGSSAYSIRHPLLPQPVVPCS